MGDLEMLPSPLLLRIEAAVGNVGDTPSDAFREITEYCWLRPWIPRRGVADKPVSRSRVVGVLARAVPAHPVVFPEEFDQGAAADCERLKRSCI